MRIPKSVKAHFLLLALSCSGLIRLAFYDHTEFEPSDWHHEYLLLVALRIIKNINLNVLLIEGNRVRKLSWVIIGKRDKTERFQYIPATRKKSPQWKNEHRKSVCRIWRLKRSCFTSWIPSGQKKLIYIKFIWMYLLDTLKECCIHFLSASC